MNSYCPGARKQLVYGQRFEAPATADATGAAPEAQSVANQLAAFAVAGRWSGIRLDLDPTARQGDAGEQSGPGGVVLDSWPCRSPATTHEAALEVSNCSGSGSAGDLIRADDLTGDGHTGFAVEKPLPQTGKTTRHQAPR